MLQMILILVKKKDYNNSDNKDEAENIDNYNSSINNITNNNDNKNDNYLMIKVGKLKKKRW